MKSNTIDTQIDNSASRPPRQKYRGTPKYYFAFRRLKNFACVEVHPQTKALLVYLKLDPASVELKNGFSRDVSSIGHFGTGDLELKIRTTGDLEAALPLIQRSYEAS